MVVDRVSGIARRIVADFRVGLVHFKEAAFRPLAGHHLPKPVQSASFHPGSRASPSALIFLIVSGDVSEATELSHPCYLDCAFEKWTILFRKTSSVGSEKPTGFRSAGGLSGGDDGDTQPSPLIGSTDNLSTPSPSHGRVGTVRASPAVRGGDAPVTQTRTSQLRRSTGINPP